MYWMLFTVAWKAVRALSSKISAGSNTAHTSSSSTVLLQLILSFISFLVTFLALLLVEPPCSPTHSRIHILLSFSSYTFLITTLLAPILLVINPPTSLTTLHHNINGIGKWRSRLLTYGIILCWVEILLAFLALAITIAIHHFGPDVFNIIALIGITVLSLGVLIFAICPEHPHSSPSRNDNITDKDLKSAERNRKRDLETETRRQDKHKKREREWEDPLASPTTPTNPHMPLTPAPGDEKAAFAKAQAERLARLRNREGYDIKPWKKWFVLGVFVVQGICLLILVILGVKFLVEGGVDASPGMSAGEGCSEVKVEVVGCVNSCGAAGSGEVGMGGGGGKESKTLTVTETETEMERSTLVSTVLGTTVRTLTETARETLTQTLTLREGTVTQIPSASGGGVGGVKTVVVLTSTTTTVL